MNTMKKFGLAAVIVTVAGFAWVKTPHRNIPADLRDAVAESDGFDTAIPSVGKMRADIPLPVAAASEGFTEAVKKEYERILAAGHGFDGLPVAKLSELPPAAQKQLAEDNQLAGVPNSSIPYKMAVQGKTVYVIQNENDEGMSVNIFSAAGARIAQGSYNEGFGWDEDSSAAGVNKLTKAPQASGFFKAAVKKEYERLTGYTDFNNGTYILNTLPIAKVSELPAAAKKQYKKDVAEWGEYYLVTPYKMPVRGQTAYVIQVETEGGSFVTIFDAKGSKIAEGGCSESGDFGWRGDRAPAAGSSSKSNYPSDYGSQKARVLSKGPALVAMVGSGVMEQKLIIGYKKSGVLGGEEKISAVVKVIYSSEDGSSNVSERTLEIRKEWHGTGFMTPALARKDYINNPEGKSIRGIQRIELAFFSGSKWDSLGGANYVMGTNELLNSPLQYAASGAGTEVDSACWNFIIDQMKK